MIERSEEVVQNQSNLYQLACDSQASGYGVMEIHPLERYFRDAMGFRFAQGSTEIQKLIISRELSRSS